MDLKPAHDWINEKYAAGARTLGVSCNADKRKVYVMADGALFVLDVQTQRHTRIVRDILHEYIARLPQRAQP